MIFFITNKTINIKKEEGDFARLPQKTDLIFSI